jgi:hydroxymethylpyrimidine pyrophosphatase-like HAD family hydrolase
MLDPRPKTIFCDIDGTLIEHFPPGSNFHEFSPKALPGVTEKILEWDKKGYRIILTTGRKESMRKFTEKQLEQAGIFYDMLIMGIGGGVRVLINDYKPNSTEETAIAIVVDRDKGIKDIEI